MFYCYFKLESSDKSMNLKDNSERSLINLKNAPYLSKISKL